MTTEDPRPSAPLPASAEDLATAIADVCGLSDTDFGQHQQLAELLQPLFTDRQRLVERDHAGIKKVLYLEGRLERAVELLRRWHRWRDSDYDSRIWRETHAFLSDSPTSETATFTTHLHRQREWSERTFGPGPRAKGVVDHIRKELAEIERDPSDLEEWIDVVILALDGAWRSGASPQEIESAIYTKQAKNEQREWPDWRTQDPNGAIEHVRSDSPTGTKEKTDG